MAAVLVVIAVAGLVLPSALFAVAHWRKDKPGRPPRLDATDAWLASEFQLGVGDRRRVRSAVRPRGTLDPAMPAPLPPGLREPARALAARVVSGQVRLPPAGWRCSTRSSRPGSPASGCSSWRPAGADNGSPGWCSSVSPDCTAGSLPSASTPFPARPAARPRTSSAPGARSYPAVMGQAVDEIRVDAEDALGDIDGLEVRRMFGGWGFCQRGLLFGAAWEGEFRFRTRQEGTLGLRGGRPAAAGLPG